MTEEELRKSIEDTKTEIYSLKDQLDITTDPIIGKRIKAKIKELRIRQLWFLDQLG